ncbi:MAG: hypothetical protein Q8908_06295 [Bacteroidota bacterium]|nr:hypothetical protein [Bacteroidota bacterium]
MENKCKTTPRPNSIKGYLKSWYFWKPFLGVTIGGGIGLLYYHLSGCPTGACPISGNAWGTTIAGSLLGLIVTNSPCTSCK